MRAAVLPRSRQTGRHCDWSLLSHNPKRPDPTRNPHLAALQPKPVAGGYDYLRFDENTARQYPGAHPGDALYYNLQGRLIVLNFIDNSPQGKKYSDMQTQVLQETLSALAPRSQARKLMQIDVVVRDENGNTTPYFTDYRLQREKSTEISGTPMPYGVVYGTGLKADSRLFDFALMNGVQNDADLSANARSIIGSIGVAVDSYNQRQLASLDPAPLN